MSGASSSGVSSNDLLEVLGCKICGGWLVDAVTVRSLCSHSFCKACFAAYWLKHESPRKWTKCPGCNLELQYGHWVKAVVKDGKKQDIVAKLLASSPAMAGAGPLYASTLESVSAPGGGGPPLEVVVLQDRVAGLVARIAPALGGKVYDLSYRGVQLLHRGGDLSPPAPDEWVGHIPILFPGVGRQRGGVYRPEPGAAPLRMPCHGFSGGCAFKIVNRTLQATTLKGAAVTLELDYTDPVPADPPADFPFRWKLTVHYTLFEGGLHTSHTVQHLPPPADGEEGGESPPRRTRRMPCAIGSHHSFRFPWVGGEEGEPGQEWDSHRIITSVTHGYDLDKFGQLSGTSWPLLPSKGKRNRGKYGFDLSERGALNGVFGFGPTELVQEVVDEGGEYPLCNMALHERGVMSVKVTQEVSILDENDEVDEEATGAAAAQRTFVLWGSAPVTGPSPSPGFVCVEPWLTRPDSLNTPPPAGISLAPGQQLKWNTIVRAHAHGGDGKGDEGEGGGGGGGGPIKG